MDDKKWINSMQQKSICAGYNISIGKRLFLPLACYWEFRLPRSVAKNKEKRSEICTELLAFGNRQGTHTHMCFGRVNKKYSGIVFFSKNFNFSFFDILKIFQIFFQFFSSKKKKKKNQEDFLLTLQKYESWMSPLSNDTHVYIHINDCYFQLVLQW